MEPFSSPPREDEVEEGAPQWVVTFGDMMSLLMVFFILIVSFSQMDVVKYRAMVGSLKTAFGAKDASMMTGFDGRPAVISLGPQSSESDAELARQVEEEVLALALGGDVDVALSERGVSLRISDNLLFDLGSADLRPYAGPLLRKVAAILRLHPCTILVEGHTDNLPIHTGRFPSNWELSAARAAAVIRHLIEREEMNPGHFMVAGFSETRPVATNETGEGRGRNRRVEFLLSRVPLLKVPDAPR